MEVVLKGTLVSGGLIVAIGAQNVHVMRQGLLEQNVSWVVLTCFLCDVGLMSVGILGVGSMIRTRTWATVGLALAGSLFLVLYGGLAFYRASRATSRLVADGEGGGTQRPSAAVLSTLMVTLANPHVYLDTVVILGGIAGSLPLAEKVQFLVGAVAASLVWFTVLGYGAGAVAPVLRKPRVWQILEVVIGLAMWWIGAGLLRFAMIALTAGDLAIAHTLVR